MRKKKNLKKTVVVPVEQRAAEQGAPVDVSAMTLLDINDGNYKYNRIPGIKLASDVVPAPTEKNAVSDDSAQKKHKKSSFHLSGAAIDKIIKISVVGLVFLLVVVLQFRKRGRRHSVLRRFKK